MRTESWAERLWYQGHPLHKLLLPLSALFGVVSRWRAKLYQWGWLKVSRMDVPVIVVGNINVGGVGKTPVVIDIVERLKADGWRPGVVSRGYGGSARSVNPVSPQSDPEFVGDEPVLIAARTRCPVAIAPRRVDAARLLQTQGVNIIVADDGLQHYALARDVEIVVLDGRRRFGNGHLLPAGPLREQPSRLTEVDLILSHGSTRPGEFALEGKLGMVEELTTGRLKPLSAFAEVHAVAGIGQPEKFFASLRENGLTLTEHPFPDHHAFRPQDLKLPGTQPILMTEKDAVKCRRFRDPRCWAVHYSVCLPEPAWQILRGKLGMPPRKLH